RYRYTGKERDEETDLYYHGARYYASWLGRWTSLDPSRSGPGQNPYVYVSDNPANKNDPTGEWEVNWSKVGRGALIAAAGIVVIAAVVVTAGAAAPLAAGGVAMALGASTTTVLTTVAVTTTAVEVGTTALLSYRAVDLAK